MCSISLWMNKIFMLFVDNHYAKMYCSLHMYEYATILSRIPVFSVGGRIFENSFPNSKTECVFFFVEYISLLFFKQNLSVSYKELAKECFVEIHIWVVYRFTICILAWGGTSKHTRFRYMINQGPVGEIVFAKLYFPSSPVCCPNSNVMSHALADRCSLLCKQRKAVRLLNSIHSFILRLPGMCQ